MIGGHALTCKSGLAAVLSLALTGSAHAQAPLFLGDWEKLSRLPPAVLATRLLSEAGPIFVRCEPVIGLTISFAAVNCWTAPDSRHRRIGLCEVKELTITGGRSRQFYLTSKYKLVFPPPLERDGEVVDSESEKQALADTSSACRKTQPGGSFFEAHASDFSGGDDYVAWDAARLLELALRGPKLRPAKLLVSGDISRLQADLLTNVEQATCSQEGGAAGAFSCYRLQFQTKGGGSGETWEVRLEGGLEPTAIAIEKDSNWIE